MTPRQQRLRTTIVAAAVVAVALVVPGQPHLAGVPGTAAPGATPTPTTGAHVYYVSVAAGNDSNNGLSLSTPFQHIAACAAVAQPGDSCLLRQGTYHETVTPANSGLPGQPITYTSYAGEPVILDGADPITTAWTLQSGAIYTTTATLPASSYSTSCLTTGTLCANQLFYDGQMMLEARWPNTTVTMGDPGSELLSPVLAKSYTGTVAALSTDVQTIVDSGANGSMADAASNQWAGGTLGMWAGSAFMEQTATIDASTATTLTVHGITYRCNLTTPKLCPSKNESYFATGLPRLLDSPGEWSYTSGSHTLSLEAPDGLTPAGHVVEAKARNFAVDLRGKSYESVTGLTITAATIIMDQDSSHNLLDQLTVTYPTHYVAVPSVPLTIGTVAGINAQTYALRDSGVVISGTANTMSNSSVQYSAGNGIAEMGSGNLVTNTLVAYSGYGGGYGSGVYMEGHDNTLTHSSIHDVGRDGVELSSSRVEGYNYVTGTNTNICPNCPTFMTDTITYNDVWHAEALGQDGGEFYGCCEVAMTGTVIAYNLGHDNLSHSAFSPSLGSTPSYSIYVDNFSFGPLIHHDVAWHQGAGGGGVILNLALNKSTKVYNLTSAGEDIMASGGSQRTTEVKNSIGTATGFATFTNAQLSNNLTTAPPFSNSAAGNYQLAGGAATAINTGVVIPGITDGFSGAAPDIGSYESGQPPWLPGCSMAICHDANSVLVAAP